MARVTDLPLEVVAIALQNLDNIWDLLPSLLACRHFYSAFKESTGTEAAILRRQIPIDLLPYAVATIEALQLPRPRTAAAVHGVLDRLYYPSTPAVSRLRSLSPNILRRMAYVDDVISSFALDFAKNAWLRIPGILESLAPSPAERFRFYRAVYRLELFHNLFREGVDGFHMPFDGGDFLFFSRYPPWENEQIGCVYHLLEEEFVKASRDVIAHDIEFGEHSVSYLDLGENFWNQGWLSMGVIFTFQLSRNTCWYEKRDLLWSRPNKGHANFHDCILHTADDRNADDAPVEDYSETQLRSLIPYNDKEDPDKGPCEAWRVAHIGEPCLNSFMRFAQAWLREWAYVLWDSRRIHEHDLLTLFSGPDRGSCLDVSSEALLEMNASFKERSKIWRKGGKEYWAKGDLSMIDWPRGKGPGATE